MAIKRLPARGPGGRFLPRKKSNPTRGQLAKRKRALTAAWNRRARVGGFTGSQDAALRRLGVAIDRVAKVKPRGVSKSTLQRGAGRGVKVMRRVDVADPRSAADYLRLGLGGKGHGTTVRELAGGDLLVVADDNRAIRVRRRKNPARKGTTMAKRRRTAAQKRATAKMIAANRRRRGGGRRKSAKRRRRSSGSSVVNRILSALGRRKRRKNPSTGGTSMARRRKRRSGARRRSRRGAIMVIRSNPRRGRRRRRNPSGGLRLSNPGTSFMAAGKTALAASIPSTLGAAAFAFVETKYLRQYNPAIRLGARVAAAGAAVMGLRRHPHMAYATMGAILGGFGSEIGVRAAGGVVTGPGKAGMREIAALASDDPEQLSALYDEMSGMGLLDTGSGDVNLGDFAEVGAAGDDVPDLGDDDEMSGEEEFADIGDDDEIP